MLKPSLFPYLKKLKNKNVQTALEEQQMYESVCMFFLNGSDTEIEEVPVQCRMLGTQSVFGKTVPLGYILFPIAEHILLFTLQVPRYRY